MKDATISELYDLTQTIAAKIFEGKTYPWEVLPLIKDFILELGETLDPAEYEKRGENIWIAKDASIAPTASINGPQNCSLTETGSSSALHSRCGVLQSFPVFPYIPQR